jgi:hypothetical protein
VTFLYGTNTELIYSMPALAATVATATKQIISGTTATCPPCVIPPLQNIWPMSQMIGKGFHFSGGGGYDYGTATTVTLALYADNAFSVATTTGVLLATTAAYSFAATTIGSWQFEVDMTCTGVGNSAAGTAQSTWYSTGTITAGSGTIGTTGMMTGTITAGVPQSITLSCASVFTFALYATPAAGAISLGMSNFMVYGCN